VVDADATRKEAPTVQDDTRLRALEALSRARRLGRPLSAAAGDVRLTPDDVLAHTAEGWVRAGDDWLPRPFDRIAREMEVLTADGPEWLIVENSRVATAISHHASAVAYYLDYGDPSRLRPLTLVIGDRTIRLASDPQTIDRLAEGGEIHLEVYRR
jgi:hypothetical protein